MFQTLLESRAATAPTQGRWTAMSAVVHATLIIGAVIATANAPEIVDGAREAVTQIHYAPVTPSRTERVVTAQRRFVLDGHPPTISVDVPRIPVPGFVDLNRRDIGTVIEFRDGGLTNVARDATPVGGVFTELTVDRIVAPRPGNPQPAYPSVLRSSGLAGTVIARFVVDTTGVVEQGSVVILETTHQSFADAVRAWLPQTRYFPAEASGRRVRQLVQQRVEFQLR